MTACPTAQDAPTATVVPITVDPVDQLRPLLRTAAELDLEDPRWAAFREEVGRTLARLVTAGHLPLHLAVSGAEPPVVLTRLLVAAWRVSVGSPTPDRDLAPRPRPTGRTVPA